MVNGRPPGRLIGSGRAADVYELDGKRVLRRYRTGINVEPEARLMTYLKTAGYPVPEVFHANGGDMVLERLDGTDMLADAARRPWLITSHARTLARLHDRLHRIEAPEWLARPLGPASAGEPEAVLHSDLHPGNVMMTRSGPVVIDWSSAIAGPAGIDAAIAALIMRVSEASDFPLVVRLVVGMFRDVFVHRFEASVSTDTRLYLAQAASLRLKDPNTRPGEAARIRQIAQSARHRSLFATGRSCLLGVRALTRLVTNPLGNPVPGCWCAARVGILLLSNLQVCGPHHDAREEPLYER